MVSTQIQSFKLWFLLNFLLSSSSFSRPLHPHDQHLINDPLSVFISYWVSQSLSHFRHEESLDEKGRYSEQYLSLSFCACFLCLMVPPTMQRNQKKSPLLSAILPSSLCMQTSILFLRAVPKSRRSPIYWRNVGSPARVTPFQRTSLTPCSIPRSQSALEQSGYEQKNNEKNDHMRQINKLITSPLCFSRP